MFFFILFGNVYTSVMAEYTQEQRLQIIQYYYQNNRSAIVAFCTLSPTTYRPPAENFERTFPLHYIQVPIR